MPAVDFWNVCVWFSLCVKSSDHNSEPRRNFFRVGSFGPGPCEMLNVPEALFFSGSVPGTKQVSRTWPEVFNFNNVWENVIRVFSWGMLQIPAISSGYCGDTMLPGLS